MAVTITAQGLEVDAEVVAAAFGLDPSTLQEKMRAVRAPGFLQSPPK
jgi:hypothetical protein